MNKLAKYKIQGIRQARMFCSVKSKNTERKRATREMLSEKKSKKLGNG